MPGLSATTHLVQGDDLAVRLLDLAELAEEVPEPRLGDNIVGRKDTHAVDLRGGVGLAGEVAADDLVFLEASCASQYCVRVGCCSERASSAIAVEVSGRVVVVGGRSSTVACVVEIVCVFLHPSAYSKSASTFNACQTHTSGRYPRISIHFAKKTYVL